MILAIGVVVVIGRRWQRRGEVAEAERASTAGASLQYDDRLNEELERMEEG